MRVVRQRVAADNRLVAVGWMEAEGEILARQKDRQRAAIERGQVERPGINGFIDNRDDSKLPPTFPFGNGLGRASDSGGRLDLPAEVFATQSVRPSPAGRVNGRSYHQQQSLRTDP